MAKKKKFIPWYADEPRWQEELLKNGGKEGRFREETSPVVNRMGIAPAKGDNRIVFWLNECRVEVSAEVWRQICAAFDN